MEPGYRWWRQQGIRMSLGWIPSAIGGLPPSRPLGPITHCVPLIREPGGPTSRRSLFRFSRRAVAVDSLLKTQNDSGLRRFPRRFPGLLGLALGRVVGDGLHDGATDGADELRAVLGCPVAGADQRGEGPLEVGDDLA